MAKLRKILWVLTKGVNAGGYLLMACGLLVLIWWCLTATLLVSFVLVYSLFARFISLESCIDRTPTYAISEVVTVAIAAFASFTVWMLADTKSAQFGLRSSSRNASVSSLIDELGLTSIESTAGMRIARLRNSLAAVATRRAKAIFEHPGWQRTRGRLLRLLCVSNNAEMRIRPRDLWLALLLQFLPVSVGGLLWLPAQLLASEAAAQDLSIGRVLTRPELVLYLAERLNVLMRLCSLTGAFLVLREFWRTHTFLSSALARELDGISSNVNSAYFGSNEDFSKTSSPQLACTPAAPVSPPISLPSAAAATSVSSAAAAAPSTAALPLLSQSTQRSDQPHDPTPASQPTHEPAAAQSPHLATENTPHSAQQDTAPRTPFRLSYKPPHKPAHQPTYQSPYQTSRKSCHHAQQQQQQHSPAHTPFCAPAAARAPRRSPRPCAQLCRPSLASCTSFWMGEMPGKKWLRLRHPPSRLAALLSTFFFATMLFADATSFDICTGFANACIGLLLAYECLALSIVCDTLEEQLIEWSVLRLWAASGLMRAAAEMVLGVLTPLCQPVACVLWEDASCPMPRAFTHNALHEVMLQAALVLSLAGAVRLADVHHNPAPPWLRSGLKPRHRTYSKLGFALTASYAKASSARLPRDPSSSEQLFDLGDIPQGSIRWL